VGHDGEQTGNKNFEKRCSGPRMAGGDACSQTSSRVRSGSARFQEISRETARWPTSDAATTTDRVRLRASSDAVPRADAPTGSLADHARPAWRSSGGHPPARGAHHHKSVPAALAGTIGPWRLLPRRVTRPNASPKPPLPLDATSPRFSPLPAGTPASPGRAREPSR
jgi:hypothetical protein